jgi:hypothetical protein
MRFEDTLESGKPFLGPLRGLAAPAAEAVPAVHVMTAAGANRVMSASPAGSVAAPSDDLQM